MNSLSRNTILTSTLFTLALAACVPTHSQSFSDGITDPDYALQIERGRNIVAPVIRRGSAVSVAVGVNGKLVWSEGFGFKSLAKEQAVSADDSFRLYSLMKQVTALAALQSVLRGEITFETTAREVFPELPEVYTRITLQHLLSHTSGIRHYHHPQEAISFAHCERAEIAMQRFVHEPLVHEPGAQESYSTYGFVLASAMLEARAGVPFGELITERTMPIGSKSFRTDAAITDSGLQYYDVNNEGDILPAPPVNNSCKMGGGGFQASAQDFARLQSAALNGDIVPVPAIRQLMGNQNTLSAGGSGVGGEGVSVIDFGTGISVVVLSNTSGLEQRLALQRVRDLLVSVFTETQAGD